MFFDDDESADSAALTSQALLEIQKRMGVMLDSMPMGLLIHTEQGIIFANRAAADLLHKEQDDLVGMHFLDFVGDERNDVANQIQSAFEGKVLQEPTELTLGEGSGTRAINLIAGPLPWQGNSVVQLLLQDISELKAKEEALRKLTITDELTGAFNRRHAFSLGNAAVERSRGSGTVCVIAMDIDHFKRINDTYGHPAGDEALRRLSSEVRRMILEKQLDGACARVGGEEFVMILPSSTLEEAGAFAECVREAVEAISIVIEDLQFGFTASFGVAAKLEVSEKFESILSRADAALYDAKNAGRNRVVVSSSKPPHAASAA